MNATDQILSICAELEAETGVNPTYSYCAVTGQPYARIFVEHLLRQVSAMDDTEIDDAKSILLTTTLGAMRPSPAWASMDLGTIAARRHDDPRGVLAYLLNRLYAPRDAQSAHGLVMTFSQRMAMHQARINCYQQASAAEFIDDDLNQLLYVLLELDASFNLNDLAPPQDIINFVWLANVKDFIQRLVNWLDFLVEKKEKDFRAAKMSNEYWSRGSALARKASASLFFEVTPPSPTRAKKIAKEKESNAAEAMLAALLKGIVSPQVAKTKEDIAVEIILEMAKEPAKPIQKRKLNNYIPAGGLKLELLK